MSRTFSSLSHHNFRIWFCGNLLGASAVWMQRVAQDWVVYTELTHESGVAIGITTALQFLPMLVFGIWAGVLADRLDRRKILITSQSLMGVLAGVTAILILTEVAHLWHMYLLAFIGGVIQAISTPARQAFVTEMVPTVDVPNAVSMNSLAFNIARMIGPALAGVMIHYIGSGWVFGANVVLFAVPVAALLAMRTGELRANQRLERKSGQIREGIRYVRNRPDILLIMIIVSVVSGIGLNYQVTSAVMARQVFDRGPGQYGLLGTALAVGAVMGALLVARQRQPRLRGVIISAFSFGAILGCLALAPNYWAFAAISVPLGVAQMFMIATANAAIQITTERHMTGRVMALYSVIFLGSTPIGSPLTGWVAEFISPRWSIGYGAIGTMLCALAAALWVRRVHPNGVEENTRT